MMGTFQLILLEHIAMCHLVTGNRSTAIKETVQALQICFRDPKLMYRHKPLIHALLGMYAMSMNITEAAETQLTISLGVSTLRGRKGIIFKLFTFFFCSYPVALMS